MILQPARLCSLLIGVLVLGACEGGGQTGGSSMPPPLQNRSTIQQDFVTTQGLRKRTLYVTSATPYFFNAYYLPLHSGDEPALTVRGVNEPVPIVDDSRDLYVGSFDDGTIYTYPLPLGSTSKDAAPAATVSHGRYVAPFSGRRSVGPAEPASNGGIPSGLGDLSGLARSGDFLYVAGKGATGEEVLEYRLPLVAGETPSSSVTGFSIFDQLGIAAQHNTLYVASTTAGTLGAYRLPLKDNELPQYTIMTTPQIDGAAGVAVDGNHGHLYVSLYTTGDVYEYQLPYRVGEKPTMLDVKSETGGELPYGIAVGEDHLFVTAGAILAYRLPITSSTRPDATVQFNEGNAAGVAVGE